MTKQSLVPEGLSHDFDLSKLSAPERMKHHTKQLNTIILFEGLNGVKEYQARNPEAAALRTLGRQIVYAPKPAGYAAAITQMVDLWFDNNIALAASNREDVERLSNKLQTNFDRDRLFSRDLTPAMRGRIEAVFKKRGAVLPDTVVNMTGVRAAVKAFKAGTAPEGQPFANIGKRVGNMLGIGTRTFTIIDHKGRECIRVSAGGKRERISLAAIQELLSGVQAEDSRDDPPLYIDIYTRELAPRQDLAFESGEGDTSGANSLGDLEPSDLVSMPQSPLAQRIAALKEAFNREPSSTCDRTRPDPLELQP